jgi:hypothetical protein
MAGHAVGLLKGQGGERRTHAQRRPAVLGAEGIEVHSLCNGLMPHASAILGSSTDLVNKFSGDARNYMNSHDFIALLFGAMKRRRYLPAGVALSEFQRVFQATITTDRMLALPLIKRIIGWAGVM